MLHFADKHIMSKNHQTKIADISSHTKQINRQMWNGNEVDASKYVDAHLYKMAHKT